MTTISIIKHDPLARLLRDRFSLNPVSLALLSALITLLTFLSVALLTNTLVSTQDQVGLLNDESIWVWELLIKPVILGYYLWESEAVENLFVGLNKSRAASISDHEISSSIKLHQRRWKTWISTVIAIIGIFTYIFSRKDLSSWGSSGIWPAMVSAAFGSISTYASSMLILGLILNVWIIQKTIKDKELNINPLHPDRCGGLRPLSQYSLKTAYLAAIFGIMIGFTEYRFITQSVDSKYWLLHLGIPIYLLISLLCFFGPLLAAHGQMKSAKEKMLDNIASQFQDDYARISKNLCLKAEELKKEVEKIRELQSFYSLTDEFPVWPFDVQTIRRYVVAVLAPLLPPLIGFLQKIVGAAFNQIGI